MAFQIVHLYDSATGEYKGDCPAQADPLTPGAYITPTCSTSTPPPATGVNQVAVFSSGSWAVLPDYRGQTIYNQATGAGQQVTVIGAIPTGFALTPPPPTLAQAQTAQNAANSAKCQAVITAGFTSSALGAVYSYPSSLVDQQNLSANVLSSTLPAASAAGWTTLQLCADSTGAWAYRPHTQAQIQQVGTDGKAAILAYLVRNASLQSQVAAATTVSQVQAIVW